MARGYGGVADHEDWAPGDVAAMLTNPFYAINIDEGLALPHEPLISEDDWGRANVGLIEELGPEADLHGQRAIEFTRRSTSSRAVTGPAAPCSRSCRPSDYADT